MYDTVITKRNPRAASCCHGRRGKNASTMSASPSGALALRYKRVQAQSTIQRSKRAHSAAEELLRECARAAIEMLMIPLMCRAVW